MPILLCLTEKEYIKQIKAQEEAIAKIKNEYYYQILVKYKYEPKLHDLLHQIQDDAQLAQKRGLNIYIDNEPERIM